MLAAKLVDDRPQFIDQRLLLTYLPIERRSLILLFRDDLLGKVDRELVAGQKVIDFGCITHCRVIRYLALQTNANLTLWTTTINEDGKLKSIREISQYERDGLEFKFGSDGSLIIRTFESGTLVMESTIETSASGND